MLANSKWIDGIRADSDVAEAARVSMYARLAAVEQALPLAAHLAEHDGEHVHRLRVATRRAVAAVELYEAWLPKKQTRWIKKRLKQIRRAAGDARDLDVLGMRLARDYGDDAAPVTEKIAGHRAEVQPAIVEIAARCRRKDCFVRHIGKLLRGIRAPKDGDRGEGVFREWASGQLAAAAAQFFESMPEESADSAALHEFRIRAKAIRYTIELVSAAFPAVLRDDCYPMVEELQERLGKVQDQVAAISRLHEWHGAKGDQSLNDRLTELAASERDRLEDAVREFRTWWTLNRAASLRAGLDASVAGTQVAESNTKPTEEVPVADQS